MLKRMFRRFGILGLVVTAGAALSPAVLNARDFGGDRGRAEHYQRVDRDHRQPIERGLRYDRDRDAYAHRTNDRDARVYRNGHYVSRYYAK